MKLIHAVALCALLCGTILFFSCSDEDNPAGPGDGYEPTDSDYVTVIMKAVNGKNEPLEEIQLRITCHVPYGDNITFDAVTDNRGIAVFDSLPPGRLSGIDDLNVSDYQYSMPLFDEEDSLLAGHTYEYTYLFLKDPIPLAVQVSGWQGEQLRPLAGVIATIENTSSDGWNSDIVTTDTNGQAFINEVYPTIVYLSQVRLELNGYTNTCRETYFTYDNGELTLHIQPDTDPFEPVISFPESATVFTGTTVRLTGEGFDFEDGVLTDKAFTWYSSRNGELGTGRDITVEMDVGVHAITLRATDSNGRFCESESIQIVVAHYDTESYFPFPLDSYWMYRFDPIAIDVINIRGETEGWTLDDMAVFAHSADTRSCLMKWTIECGDVRLACRYSITDHIALDDGQFFVTSTDEQLTLFGGPGVFDAPVEDLTSTTIYTPRYPFLSDYHDPTVNGYVEMTVTANNTIAYTMVGIGTHTYIGDETITVSYEAGSPETITSTVGSFNTIPFVTRIGDIERTWYLAAGIGIVQFETELSGTMVSAQLYETNMDSYAPAARMAGFAATPVVVAVGNDGQHLELMRRIMRGYCPF